MTEIGISKDVHIGLAVTSDAGPAVPAEARFSNVSVAGKTEAAGERPWALLTVVERSGIRLTK